MTWRMTIAALCALAASSAPCLAADPRYPDWPCTQAKVPDISLAAVWAGPPLDDASQKWKDDAGNPAHHIDGCFSGLESHVRVLA